MKELIKLNLGGYKNGINCGVMMFWPEICSFLLFFMILLNFCRFSLIFINMQIR